MKAILFDTETTGVENPEVIEMAWFGVMPPSEFVTGWSQGPTIVERFNPTSPIQFGAMNTHHILPMDVEDSPSHTTKQMPACEFLIGHNIDFDWKAMGSPHVKRICTLALCRSLFPAADSHSLGAMLYFLEGALPETRDRLRNAHSAAADIANNWTVLQHCIAKLGVVTIEELYAASELARIPKTMTFGKHKGKPIAEVDRGYAKWYFGQLDTDPYLIQAFRDHGLLPPGRNP